MRRSTAWTLAATLLLAAVSPLTVSSESGTATRVVEIPRTGLAAALPADWRVWSPSTGVEPIVIATHVRTHQKCGFSMEEGAASAEGAARETSEMIEAHKQLELVARDFLVVPAGDAVHVSYRYRSAPHDPRFVLHQYYVTGPDGVASVYCSGADPPADRWRSIIDALEVLGEETRAPVPFDPRVEVPSHGLALDFGAEWLVEAWPGPGPLFGWPAGDRGLPPRPTSVLRAVTATGGPTDMECFVEVATGLADLPDGDSTAEWQAAFVSSAGPRSGKTSVPGVTLVDLTSGPAVRADWKQWRGMPATAWVFLESERRIVLFCRSNQPPADAWHSIAASVEFPPSVGSDPRARSNGPAAGQVGAG